MSDFFRHRPRVVIVVTLVLLASFIQPPPAFARPECETWDYWYAGCPMQLEGIGYQGIDCEGYHWQDGTSVGAKWWWHQEYSCQSTCNPVSFYAEWCGSTSSWKLISEAAFLAGTCTC